MPDPERWPLSPAQQRTSTELPWYRAWLLSTGRTEAEVDSTTDQHAPPVDTVVVDDSQEQ
jgi:hypothetical protein